jgi:Uma2 family endonuclease
VWIDPDDHTWREPDIFVSCRECDGFSREPRVVVEVLSPSTEKEDRTRKLDFYRRFDRIESMMLVWQDTRRVELHERTHAGWLVRDVIGSGVIALPTLRVEISLDEIYA